MSLPGLFEMCARLVAEPSVSCASPAHDQGNRKVIDQLATWCTDLGADVEVQPIDGAPGKANLIARFGAYAGCDHDGGLVLAGHTDTVPWDAGRWRQDPFALRDEGERWVGLGICDMKGFFPLALAALQPLLSARGDARLAAPVTLLATADEESTMAGARQLVASGAPKARYAVIGEPTDLKPVYAHKGMAMLAIRLHGRSGHSSNPGLGVNALDAMHAVITELLVFRTELAARHCHPGFEVQVPTMNLGCLHAGDSPNRICGSAELQIDLRLVPGMDTDEVTRALCARVRPVAEKLGVHWHVEHLFPPTAAFETSPDSDFVRSCEQFSGQRAGTVAFGTEGPYLQALGMETVVLGPGHIDQAHQPDEFLRVDRVAPTIELLRHLIVDRCSRR